jgi:PAS domain S-box-containing protein
MERKGYWEDTYFTWSYSPIRDAAGRVRGLFCAVTEETERVRAEAERDRLAAQRQLALDGARLGWWHYDPVTRVSTFDQRYAEIFGVTGPQRPNDEILKRLHPDDLPGVWAKVEAALDPVDPKPYSAEYRIVRDDGSVRWIEARGSATFESDGENAACRATSFVGTVADITGRKWAEQLLAAQNRALQLAAAGAPLSEILGALTAAVEEQSGGQAIAAVLLVGEDECTLRTGAAPNLPAEYCAAIDGIKAKEGLGTCADAAARNQVVVTPDLAAARSSQGLAHLPLALGLKAAWSMPIRASDGQVLGTFGTYFRECREPTERERQVVEGMCRVAALAIERRRSEDEREHLLQRERDARADAEAANRAKDKFLAVLSHELRTPLSPVVMTIPAMEIDPDMPFKFHEDLAMVRRNIDLEVKLIDDLLDLSRVTSGKLRLHTQPVRVHELLTHVLRSSANESAGKRLSVRHEFHATNDRLTADPARLQQVFWNLLRNAVKFTPEGGEITLSTRNADQDGHLLVEVRDSGVGIPPDILPRVFDAFEQGDARMTRQFGGLGLGLAIAKAVVEMHGGTITADSDGRDRGAVFTVRLATVSLDAAAVPRAGGRAPGGRNGSASPRVLLVEDHPDTARTLSRLLQTHGYDVRTASSVASALQLAAAEPFDVVVSDIGLPDATGYELMEQIKARHGISGIALSGYGMEDDMKRSRDAGFVDHVVKPVNVQQLETVIGRLLAGDYSPWTSPS